MQKYCKSCKLLGHKETECYVLHPELEQVIEDEECTEEIQHTIKNH